MKSSRLSPAGRLWGWGPCSVKAGELLLSVSCGEEALRSLAGSRLPLSSGFKPPWDCGREGVGPTVGAQRPRKQAAVGTRLQAARRP